MQNIFKHYFQAHFTLNQMKKNFECFGKNHWLTPSKSGETVSFQKGLVHAFGQKLTIFPSFFFWQYRPGKCVFRYSKTKKRVSQLLKKKFKEWKNCHFSKGVSPWFWSKIGHFPIFLFKIIQARKMWFTIFQNEKTCF